MANQTFAGKPRFWQNEELRKRFLFLLGALIVFRFGAHIPVPGVDAAALAKLYESAGNSLLGMLNMFSGGSLERFSIFAIGIMPYISASIIMQLVSEISPNLKSLKKEGEAGRKLITKYTRYGTVLLAIIQSFTAATFVYQQGIVVVSQFEFYLSTVCCLVGGTMFLMWLGEQLTERGIGNGISFLITAGIMAGIPSGLIQLYTLVDQGAITALALIVGVLVLLYGVVFFESGQRKVPVHYAKRQVSGRFAQQRQSTHIPFKLNMAGVIPPIFASSIIMLPTALLGWLQGSEPNSFASILISSLQHGTLPFMVLFASAIIFFCYFYTALAFSPKEISENLKKSGAFIPGIRPGQYTSQYLEQIVLRLTFFGAIYITIVCLIPELITGFMGVPFYLGGTSLLILVVVSMDFNNQVNSYRVSQQYETLMRRNNNL